MAGLLLHVENCGQLDCRNIGYSQMKMEMNCGGAKVSKPWMIYIPNPCNGCIWNNKKLCGKDFCIFPRCLYNTAERGGRTGKSETPGAG